MTFDTPADLGVHLQMSLRSASSSNKTAVKTVRSETNWNFNDVMTRRVRLMMMTQLFASDPKVLDGSPVFAGTVVTVQSLFDYLAEGESVATFLDDHPTVSAEQVAGALDEREMH